MKKFLFAAILTGFAGLPFFVKAQDVIEKKEGELEKVEKDKRPGKKETEEIIIRNKGDKEMKLKVEINGEDIIVNGKPLADFIDKNISINKRKMIIRDGDKMMQFDFGEGADGFGFGKNFNYNFKMDDAEGENKRRAFLGVTTEGASGGAVKVVEVSKGSAAEKAGIKKDDIITKIDNEKITTPEGLADVIAFKKPADEVKVTYKRDGKDYNAKVTLGNKKQSNTRSYSSSAPNPQAHVYKMPKLHPVPNMEGLNQDFSGDIFGSIEGNQFEGTFDNRKKIGLKLQDTEEAGNVKVINVEDSSAAAIAGLKKDDLITEINGNKIDNTDDAREELVPEADRKSYKIKVNRNGAEMMFDVKIPRKLKTANF